VPDPPPLATWRSGLDDLQRHCAAAWSLRLGRPYVGPHLSYVTPARTDDGVDVVLKLQYPHREVVHEAEALRRWSGNGAVRLLDADPTCHALLLERAVPGTALGDDAVDAIGVVVDLLPRLWIPAGAPFTALCDEAARWREHLADPRLTRGLDPALVDRARGCLAELGPSSTEAVLVHQDLHGANVVAASRAPWLVIDPKPLSGERAFSLAPIVRSVELGHSRDAVRRRLDRLSAELGVDRDRARGWTIGQTMAWAAGGAAELVARSEQVVRWLVAS
jgi:streptomycin 6-kinase